MTRFCGRKVSLWMFLLVAIPVLVLSTSLVYANDVDEWTIMVYVDGDNDLEELLGMIWKRWNRWVP